MPAMTSENETVKLAYSEAGAGAAVVLLHGYPFNRSMWRGQVAALRDNYRVITPDLRGLGASPVAAGATMADMARDVAALLDELKIERAVVGGLSMGGYVTLEFARLFPERLRGLILADTKAAADNEAARAGREKQAQLILAQGLAAIIDDFLPKMTALRAITEQPEVVAEIREMILAANPSGAAAAQRGMAARRGHLDYLPQVTAPALIITGREDAPTPVAEAELMAAALPTSRLVIIEGAGHVANLERPEEFNAALLGFLREIL
jgi:pimeloyl-ACP methyl ester carboxylesterase